MGLNKSGSTCEFNAYYTLLELVSSLQRDANRREVDEAKRLLNSVFSGFTEGVDNLDLIEAKTVLEQLSV